jgi:hypothetical protein
MSKRRKQTMLDALERNATLFDRTIQKTNNKLSGQGEYDEDLAIYRKLSPPHFDRLANEFGFDSVGQYIKEMEAKRMRRE